MGRRLRGLQQADRQRCAPSSSSMPCMNHDKHHHHLQDEDEGGERQMPRQKSTTKGCLRGLIARQWLWWWGCPVLTISIPGKRHSVVQHNTDPAHQPAQASTPSPTLLLPPALSFFPFLSATENRAISSTLLRDPSPQTLRPRPPLTIVNPPQLSLLFLRSQSNRPHHHAPRLSAVMGGEGSGRPL